MYRPYFTINFSLFLIILAVFIYAAGYPYLNKAQVPSACELILKKKCNSTGLSRGFAQIIQGNIDKAQELNPSSVKIFTFLLVQMVLRIIFSLLNIQFNTYQSQIITIDTTQAIAFSIYSFDKIFLDMISFFKLALSI